MTISRDEDDRVTVASALKLTSTILGRRMRSLFGRRIAYIPVFLDASHVILDRVDKLVDAGHIKVHIDHTYDFTLEGVLTALQQSENGRTVGKSVVVVLKVPADQR